MFRWMLRDSEGELWEEEGMEEKERGYTVTVRWDKEERGVGGKIRPAEKH